MRRTYLTMRYKIIVLRLKIINFIRGLIASVMKKLSKYICYFEGVEKVDTQSLSAYL